MTIKILRGKKKTGEIVPPDPAVPPSTDTPPAPRARMVPPRAPSAAKNRQKVLLSVADGKIEWEKLSAEGRKQFEDLFKDPDFLGQFGLTGKNQAFDPDQVKYIYDAISTMYQTVTHFFLKWPPEILAMLAYTPDQKKLLAEPTANLMNKLAPAFLMKHQELLVWGAVFSAVTQQNFKAATDRVKQLQAEKRPAIVPGPGARPAPGDLPAPRVGPIIPQVATAAAAGV